ncbi:MAG: ion transporter [Pleurocapsa sp.]
MTESKLRSQSNLYSFKRKKAPVGKKLRYFSFKMLEVTHHDDLLGRAFDNFMIALISLNTIAFAFETVYSISIPHKSYFNNFETFSVAIFTIEYGLRLWTCTLKKNIAIPYGVESSLF